MSSVSMTNHPPPGADVYSRSRSNPCACCCADAEEAAHVTHVAATHASARHDLELRMEPPGEHVLGAAVRVVRGVHEELVIGGEPDRAEEVVRVEDLEELLRRGVVEPTVAGERVDSAERHVPGVRVRDPRGRERDPGDVERAAP